MKKFFVEFKNFISKGNILDLAVAVVIGNAFNAIVSSLVQNIIMPIIGLVMGGINISDWKWVITPADEAAGTAEAALYYGRFLQSVIDFLIIAFSVFVALKVMLRFKEGFKKIQGKRPSGVEKKEMLAKGLNPKSAKDLASFRQMKVEEEAARAREEKANNPTEIDLLKEIRDLLKEKEERTSE